eukprot:4160701-Ditylum_brightwellii.AAC.1
MEHLAATMSIPPTKKQIEEFEAIEKVKEKARKKGERKCKKIYVSGAASHPEIKKAKLKTCLLDLLTKWNSIDTRTKWKMVEKLADITDSRHILRMPNQAPKLAKSEAWRLYYHMKKNRGTLWSTRYEQQAKEMEDEGRGEELQNLHNK